MQPTHGGQLWTESPGSGGTSTTARAVPMRVSSTEWEIRPLAVGESQQGAFLEVDGPGLGHTLVDVESPYVIDANGDLVQGGTAAFVLADDGAGGYVTAAVGATPAAALLADGATATTIFLVPTSADELDFLTIGNGTTSY